MRDIPRAALVLGFGGLIPFLIGVALVFSPPGVVPTLGLTRSQPVGGEFLLVRYGTIILCFMAGALWGFAARPGRVPSFVELLVAVLPAIFMVYALNMTTSKDTLIALAVAFVAILPADFVFQRGGLAPTWWLALRLPITAVVAACLIAGAVA